MTKVVAGITTSVDGYITGPDDGPGKGLGEGGERLHYWVFGGPWTYDGGRRASRPARTRPGWRRRSRGSARSSADGGRTRRPGTGATRTRGGCRSSSSRTGRRKSRKAARSRSCPGSRRRSSERREAAGDKDVHVMGGADVIRQALEAGLVDELHDHHRADRPGRRQAALRGVLAARSTSSTSACASRRSRRSSTTA